MDYEVNNRVSLWTIIKRFLLGILLVAVVIFILLWLFPTKSSLNPLLQDVFRRNIESMRDAGEKYFTNERMPEKVGDKVRITLGEMLDKNLLLQFTDKNGKYCSNTKSYIEVTKKETEYEMKVNLSCPTEEAFIIVPLGCIDRCIDCKEGETKPTATAEKVWMYEFQKPTSVKELTGYDCPSGYKQDPNNKQICYKEGSKIVETKAQENKKVDTKDVIKNETYKYLYTKTTGKKYSEWSNWSEDKVYTENDNIIWGEQELVNNAKNGYSKKTITTTKYDKTKPIYQITNDNIIGTYKQYLCSEYTYFKDSQTSKVYQSGKWNYQKNVTLDYVPSDTNTIKYVYIGIDFAVCGENCTLKPQYTYEVYTRTINEESRTKEQLSAVCNVEEKTINVYGMKKSFVGYLANQVKEVQYTYYYHTKTRTVVEEGKTSKEWSTSDNDKKLINAGYKYTGEKEATKTTTTCPKGYELNSSKTKCEKVEITYSCPAGKRIGKSCFQEVATKLTKAATPKYKTVPGVTYTWAKTKTLSGWTPTGRSKQI